MTGERCNNYEHYFYTKLQKDPIPFKYTAATRLSLRKILLSEEFLKLRKANISYEKNVNNWENKG